ncbi:hypothetical protein D3C86_918980 [compost metagenome]
MPGKRWIYRNKSPAGFQNSPDGRNLLQTVIHQNADTLIGLHVPVVDQIMGQDIGVFLEFAECQRPILIHKGDPFRMPLGLFLEPLMNVLVSRD